jgi:hypothetical protein
MKVKNRLAENKVCHNTVLALCSAERMNLSRSNTSVCVCISLDASNTDASRSASMHPAAAALHITCSYKCFIYLAAILITN